MMIVIVTTALTLTSVVYRQTEEEIKVSFYHKVKFNIHLSIFFLAETFTHFLHDSENSSFVLEMGYEEKRI